MDERFCQECGSLNDADAKYCARCRSELRDRVPPAAPVIASGPPTYVPPAAPGGTGVAGPYAATPNSGQHITPAEYAELEWQKQVNRTGWGTLLLAVAFPIGRILAFEFITLIGALVGGRIPLLELIGLPLALIGTILVVRGRSAFGPRHSKFVVVSVTLYVVSFILVTFFIVRFLIATLDAFAAGQFAPGARFLLFAFWPFVTGVIGATALAGIAEVLLVWDLEEKFGRYLLYAALVATVAVPIGTVLVLMPSFEEVRAQIANGIITSPYDPRLVPLYNAGAILNLVAVIPSFLFSGAYILCLAADRTRGNSDVDV